MCNILTNDIKIIDMNKLNFRKKLEIVFVSLFMNIFIFLLECLFLRPILDFVGDSFQLHFIFQIVVFVIANPLLTWGLLSLLPVFDIKNK